MSEQTGASVRVFEPPRVKRAPEPEFVDLTKLTKGQLAAYAEGEGIDLAGASTKAQMIDVIASAPLPPVGESGPEGIEVPADGTMVTLEGEGR